VAESLLGVFLVFQLLRLLRILTLFLRLLLGGGFMRRRLHSQCRSFTNRSWVAHRS
jgi:hypothetical protein